MSRTIVGLDIGACCIRTVIGEIDSDGGFRISGTSEVPSAGIRSGVIVNIGEAIQAIKASVGAAEMNSGCTVTSCITGIGGDQIDSQHSNGRVGIPTKGKVYGQITEEDIDRVIESSKSAIAPIADKDIIHVLTQDYIVNDMRGIKTPLGMQAYKLEAEVLIVRTSATQIQNIKTCLAEGEYVLDGVMLKTLAAAQAVTAPDELESGSVLIDIGYDTTDAVVICENAPVCTVSVPLGGKHVTRDIAGVKGISDETAEKLKREHGWCWEDGIDVVEEVLIPGVGGQAPEQTTNKELCQIIQARMEEIFVLVREEISRRQVVRGAIHGNIVLTGGGAKVRGAESLAQYVFQTLNVRIGAPLSLGGITEDYCKPEFATAVGLVLMGKMAMPVAAQSRGRKSPVRPAEDRPGFLKKLKDALF